MLHSKQLCKNPYPGPNQFSSLRFILIFLLICAKTFLEVSFHYIYLIRNLNNSSSLATCPSHLNLIDLIILSIIGVQYKLLVVKPSPLTILIPNTRLTILFLRNFNKCSYTYTYFSLFIIIFFILS